MCVKTKIRLLFVSLLSTELHERHGFHGKRIKVGSINSIFYFLHKTAEPFNCLEQDNLA